VGGFPRGRIIEIYGPESSGKTTLTLTAIAQAQKLGGLAAFIDVEHALDPHYARKLGVNLDELLVSQPSSGEEALRICETLVRSNALDIIVLDSVAALVTKSELEGEIGDAVVGAQARLMSNALRKLTASIDAGEAAHFSAAESLALRRYQDSLLAEIERTQSGAASTDRGFTINGTAVGHQATLNASGTGPVNFTNPASPAYGTTAQTRGLNLSGTNTGTNTLAALIVVQRLKASGDSSHCSSQITSACRGEIPSSIL
jgi:hypothetical protein